jgi:hypothetical protein
VRSEAHYVGYWGGWWLLSSTLMAGRCNVWLGARDWRPANRSPAATGLGTVSQAYERHGREPSDATRRLGVHRA